MIVERAQLVGANSLSQATANLGLTLGPLLGTAVYFSLGPRWSFCLDALSFAVSAAAIREARLPAGVAAEAAGPRSLASEFREGLDRVLGERAVRTAALASCLVVLGGGAANVCDLYLLTRDLGLAESALGVVASVQGAAMVVTSLSVLTLARRPGVTRSLVWGGMAVMGTALAGVGLSPGLAWVLGWSAVLGAGNSAGNIGVATLLQSEVKALLLGRVAGVINAAAVLCALAGTGAAGVAAARVSVRPIMTLAGLLALVGGVVAYLGLRGDAAGPGACRGSLKGAAADGREDGGGPKQRRAC